MTELNWERMNREVYCFHCKEYTMTIKPAPICGKCKCKLYTVCRSIITGKRLTGELDNIVPFPSFQGVTE